MEFRLRTWVEVIQQELLTHVIAELCEQVINPFHVFTDEMNILCFDWLIEVKPH